MSPQWSQLLQLVAYLGLILGVIGTVTPVLPGPVLVWASMLLWAWTDGFRAVGWPTLAVLAVLAILAELSDIILSATGAKKGGASWQSMAVAGVAAIAGLILFSLIGAIIGAFFGIVAVGDAPAWRGVAAGLAGQWKLHRGLCGGDDLQSRCRCGDAGRFCVADIGRLVFFWTRRISDRHGDHRPRPPARPRIMPARGPLQLSEPDPAKVGRIASLPGQRRLPAACRPLARGSTLMSQITGACERQRVLRPG